MTDRPPCRHRSESFKPLETVMGLPVFVHWCNHPGVNGCCSESKIDNYEQDVEHCGPCIRYESVKATKRDPVEAED